VKDQRTLFLQQAPIRFAKQREVCSTFSVVEGMHIAPDATMADGIDKPFADPSASGPHSVQNGVSTAILKIIFCILIPARLVRDGLASPVSAGRKKNDNHHRSLPGTEQLLRFAATGKERRESLL
jgi:hypothetical protein